MVHFTSLRPILVRSVDTVYAWQIFLALYSLYCRSMGIVSPTGFPWYLIDNYLQATADSRRKMECISQQPGNNTACLC